MYKLWVTEMKNMSHFGEISPTRRKYIFCLQVVKHLWHCGANKGTFTDSMWVSGVGCVNVTGDNSISDEKGKQGYLERRISFEIKGRPIPDICHGRQGQCPCNFFWAGVNFSRCNAKGWPFYFETLCVILHSVCNSTQCV